jgi:alpha-N-arabinofuranosidase
VLQALILTEGDKMVLTPTYHVFDMYKVHQDATFLPVELKSDNYTLGETSFAAVNASASRDAQGRVHLSLANLDAKAEVSLKASIAGEKFSKVSGQVLTAATMDAENTFDSPNQVRSVEFGGASLSGSDLTAKLPPRSVVVLTLAR